MVRISHCRRRKQSTRTSRVNELSSRRSASAAGPAFIKTLPTCSGPCPTIPDGPCQVHMGAQSLSSGVATPESHRHGEAAGCAVGGVGTGSLTRTRVPPPPPGAAGALLVRASRQRPWCSAPAPTHPGECSWRREAMRSCQPDTGAISDSCLSQIFSPRGQSLWTI